MTEPVRSPHPPRKRAPSHRARMHAAGLRPLTIWVPDTSDPNLADKIKRQCMAVAEHDPAGDEILAEIEAGHEAPEWKE